ncbi:hypothetical protein FRX31_019211 [Thalictrum thalictroides]|uniref:FBD domain-containing protein n=1 Tax=Thalictrum thalictroides TaxID=46969 RepID=A0A7J6W1Z0_THATH|nr:hypothetical protein FRX31_019211 [Thalictrum thalictroides]
MLALYHVSLSLPETIEFSMLKVLKLTDVKFSDYNQVDRLISSCPLLEDLSIHLFMKRDDNNTHIIISAANLKKLFLIITTNGVIEVQICCRNLCSIRYLGSPPDIHPEVLPFLSSAKIQYNPYSINLASSVYIRRTSKILKSLQNVATLQLDWVCIEFLNRDRDLLSHLPTSCCSLRELFVGIWPTKNQVQVVLILLGSYSNLQDLSISFYPIQNDFIDMLDDMLSNEGFWWQSQEISGEGAVKNLKTVKVNLFSGSDVEFELVRYLLGNANDLVSMTISYTKELHEDAARQLSVSQKVLEFTKASPYVEISLS